MVYKMTLYSNISDLRDLLNQSIDSTPDRVSVYFKKEPGSYGEHDQFMGITVPTLRRIAKDFLTLSFDDLSLLIKSPFNEERLLALILLTNRYKKGNVDEQHIIFEFYKKHMMWINNWNLVDASAHLIVGAYLYHKNDIAYHDQYGYLFDLAASEIMWERRIGIVSTWYCIRQNDLRMTFDLAERLRNDPCDLIHKAVGWMLREAGKKDVHQLTGFLDKHSAFMPRTMLRYSIEKLSQDQRYFYMNQ